MKSIKHQFAKTKGKPPGALTSKSGQNSWMHLIKRRVGEGVCNERLFENDANHLIIKMMMIDYPFLLGDAGVSLDQKGVVTSKQTPD